MVSDAPKARPSVPRPGAPKRRRGTFIVVKHLTNKRVPGQPPYTLQMPADRQGLIERLREHGQRRHEADAASRRELDAIAALLPAALEAGISKREIARLARVSRPTLDEMLKRHR